MLLNQCLAISLAPTDHNPDGQTESAKANESKPSESKPSNSSAQQLFQQLIEQNLKHRIFAQEEDQRQREKLRDALGRIEFAGFVVPSWLLLSGSFNDLNCIKSGWLEGNLEPPERLKIDTIGNIRSVNVDYFDLHLSEQHTRTIGEPAAAQLPGNRSQSEAIELSRQQQNLQPPTHYAGEQLECSKFAPEFAPLDCAIIESLSELARLDQHSAGIQVDALVFRLSQHNSHWTSDDFRLFDCAVGRLVGSGQLELRPSERQTSSRSTAGQLRSAFAGKLMVLANVDDRARPSGDRQRRPSRLSTASSTIKSKSTTLDSGIHSWDLGSSPASESTAPDRPLSLARSRSLGPRRLAGAPARSAERRWRSPEPAAKLTDANTHLERSTDACTNPDKQAQIDTHTYANVGAPDPLARRKATTLSSLFRSKSMRIISTSARQRHEKATEIHCDSRLAWPARANKQQATIDYLARAHEHRRTFSIRRQSLLTFKDELGGGARIAQFLRKLFSMGRSRARPKSEGPHRATSRLLSAELATTVIAEPAHPFDPDRPIQRQANCEPQRAEQSSASPLSSCSSGSNSLIEILDCRSALEAANSAKHKLGAQRASISSRPSAWRPSLKRAPSSLSQESAASCSSANSTVSQQLRRHLDEAYRRHRNCTSQREKEFIDSINVLRQASRHALQSPRSPSKGSRGTKSVFTKGDDNTSAYVLPCTHELHHSELSAGCACQQMQNSDEGSNSASNASDHPDYQSAAEIQQQQHKLHPQHYPLPQHYSDLNVLLANESREPQAANTGLADWQLEEAKLAAATCCICSSFALSAARLCPLACCPANSLPCCLAPPRSQLVGRTPGEQIDPAAPANFCCPLWRSMFLSYPPPTVGSNTVTPMHQHSVGQSASSEQIARLENYVASQHQVQQQQHNTTIDLKIEIGADFKRKMEKSARKFAHQALDSLEDSDQTTDESLGKSDNFSRDSCQS